MKIFRIIMDVIFVIGLIPMWLICAAIDIIMWCWASLLERFSEQARLRRMLMHDAFDFGYDWNS